jgi:hypothetical protein
MKNDANRKDKATQEFIYGKKYAEKQFAQKVKKLGEGLDELYKKYREVEGLRTELVRELSKKKGIEQVFRR